MSAGFFELSEFCMRRSRRSSHEDARAEQWGGEGNPPHPFHPSGPQGSCKASCCLHQLHQERSRGGEVSPPSLPAWLPGDGEGGQGEADAHHRGARQGGRAVETEGSWKHVGCRCLRTLKQLW